MLLETCCWRKEKRQRLWMHLQPPFSPEKGSGLPWRRHEETILRRGWSSRIQSFSTKRFNSEKTPPTLVFNNLMHPMPTNRHEVEVTLRGHGGHRRRNRDSCGFNFTPLPSSSGSDRGVTRFPDLLLRANITSIMEKRGKKTYNRGSDNSMIMAHMPV